MSKILIISAHADDESFGMGGTLLKLSEVKSNELYWLICTFIWEPKWTKEAIRSRLNAIDRLNERIGFREIIRWDYKDNCLDQVPLNELQEAMIGVLDRIRPGVIFTPSRWDFNFEHRMIFDLVEMSSKPYYSGYIKEILAYEIPSSSDASFSSGTIFPPNTYYGIEGYLEKKLELMQLFETELHAHPHQRSREYVQALAVKRGGESGFHFAEGFHLLRTLRP